MFTYIIGIVITFLVTLTIRGKKTFTKPVDTGIICALGAILLCSVVSLSRLDKLDNKVEVSTEYSLLNYKYAVDTTYIFRDTVKTVTDTTSNFYIKTKTYPNFQDVPENLREKVKYKVKYWKYPIKITENGEILVRYKDGDDIQGKVLDEDVIVLRGDYEKVNLVYLKQEYIGDNWSSDVGLPYKNTNYVLYVPNSDKLITEKVLSNYITRKSNGNLIAQYNI